MNLRDLLFLWLATAAGLVASPLDTRVFTDAQGRILRGEIIALDEQAVTVRRADDAQVFTLRIATLSSLDQAFLTREREAIREALTPLPETDFIRALRTDFTLLNSRASGLIAPPDGTWARTRRFVVLYGYHDNPLPHFSWFDDLRRIQSADTAILFVGPSTLGSHALTPEVDLKMARLFPPGVAVIRREALLTGSERAQAELARIAEEESPGHPELFFGSLERRSAAERLTWQSRVRGVLPPYWPAPGFLMQLGYTDPTNKISSAYLLDREGAPLEDPALREALSFESIGVVAPRTPPAAPTPAQASPVPAATPSTTAPGTAPVQHEFVNRQGARLRATVLAIGKDSVRVSRLPDGREFLLSREELSEQDQARVAGWALDPRYALAQKAEPVPPRPGAEAERGRAGRFATDVLVGDSTDRTQFYRWLRRPQLIVFAETPEQAALVRAHYEALSAAAGFVGLTDDKLRLVVGVGSPGFLEIHRAEFSARVPSRIDDWSWSSSYGSDGALSAMCVTIGLTSSLEDRDRRFLARRMAAGFGVFGREATSWKDSLFHPDSLATTYTEADLRLLRTAYRHVASGSRRHRLNLLVEKNWVAPDAEPQAE